MPKRIEGYIEGQGHFDKFNNPAKVKLILDDDFLAGGDLSIVGADISALNLAPDLAVKTNSSGVLVSTNLNVTDINNLQFKLDQKANNPLDDTMQVQDLITAYDTTPVSLNTFIATTVNNDITQGDRITTLEGKTVNITSATQAPDETTFSGKIILTDLVADQITSNAGGTFIQMNDPDIDINATTTNINGDLAVTGTVDGRDVALDGTNQDDHIADATVHFTEASIDHASILNIGTNSHADIDTHIADDTLHFTEASISHLNIVDIGTYSHADIDMHIADTGIHFTEASISHANITDIGTNSHADIDTHIADASVHFTEASISHLNIADIGTNSHADIDTHIADDTLHRVILDGPFTETSTTLWSSQETADRLFEKIDKIDKGAVNGVAELDSSGKVPFSQMPINSLELKGMWNADTNTPTLVDGVGVQGNYYIVSVAGTTLLDGNASWDLGSWVVFTGTVWEEIQHFESVTCVNDKTGCVMLNTDDIAEGLTNKYYNTKNNFTATAKPFIFDDNTQGYSVGSRWMWNRSGIIFPYTYTKTLYVCMDSTTNLAVWREDTLLIDDIVATADRVYSSQKVDSLITTAVGAINSDDKVLKAGDTMTGNLAVPSLNADSAVVGSLDPVTVNFLMTSMTTPSPYIVSNSDSYFGAGATAIRRGWEIFDGNASGSGWYTSDNTYNSTTGYANLLYNTVVDGVAVYGSWVSIDVGNEILFSSYALRSTDGGGYRPADWMIATSLDGVTWTLADSQVSQGAVIGVMTSYAVAPVTARFIRFIGVRIFSPGTARFTIAELVITKLVSGFVGQYSLDVIAGDVGVHDNLTVGGVLTNTEVLSNNAHRIRTDNPHNVTRAQLGLDTTDTVTFANITTTGTITNSAITANSAHILRTDNPHNVTKAQLGLDITDTVTFANLTATGTITNSAITANSAHILRTDNPHNVTSTQLGLGVGDNVTFASVTSLLNTDVGRDLYVSGDILQWNPSDNGNMALTEGYTRATAANILDYKSVRSLQSFNASSSPRSFEFQIIRSNIAFVGFVTNAWNVYDALQNQPINCGVVYAGDGLIKKPQEANNYFPTYTNGDIIKIDIVGSGGYVQVTFSKNGVFLNTTLLNGGTYYAIAGDYSYDVTTNNCDIRILTRGVFATNAYARDVGINANTFRINTVVQDTNRDVYSYSFENGTGGDNNAMNLIAFTSKIITVANSPPLRITNLNSVGVTPGTSYMGATIQQAGIYRITANIDLQESDDNAEVTFSIYLNNLETRHRCKIRRLNDRVIPCSINAMLNLPSGSVISLGFYTDKNVNVFFWHHTLTLNRLRTSF